MIYTIRNLFCVKKRLKTTFSQGLDYVDSIKTMLVKKFDPDEGRNGNGMKCKCRAQENEQTCETGYSWFRMRGNSDQKLLSKNYNDILANAVKESVLIKQIGNDLHRTFPEVIIFKKEKPG